MARTGVVVTKLSELVDGLEATCFAALVKKTRGFTRANQPFVKCLFRDKRVKLETPLWVDHPLYQDSETWTEGRAYRIVVRGKYDLRYGMQMELLALRLATDDDAADGYDFFDLVEESLLPADELLRKLNHLIEQYLEHPALKQLVKDLLNEHHDAFMKMPAAQTMHHPYTSGLLEHVWSMTRIASFLAEHYARYYDQLNPPFNRGVVIAATILHDIGKLRELEYHPVEAKYTKEGRLLGHILMGRDMVRDAARRIEGFPEDLLLRLEHAILSHHGKREFGAPVLPQTLEALLVSHIDDLDAKMNIAARELMRAEGADGFTERVYALDNRQFYRGLPEAAAPSTSIPPLT